MWWEIARVCIQPYPKGKKLTQVDMADLVDNWQGYFFNEQGNEVDVEYSPQFIEESDQDPEPEQFTVAQNIVNIWIEAIDGGHGDNSFSAIQSELDDEGCSETFWAYRKQLFQWAKEHWEFWPKDYASERFQNSYGFLIACKCDSHSRWNYYEEDNYFVIEEIHDLELLLPKLEQPS